MGGYLAVSLERPSRDTSSVQTPQETWLRADPTRNLVTDLSRPGSNMNINCRGLNCLHEHV